MRRFLFTAAAVFSLTSIAHAEDKTMHGLVTACNTPEAIEAFAKQVWIEGEDPQKFFDEMGDVCKMTYRVFEPSPSIKKWTDIMHGQTKRYNYSIVPIAVQIEGVAVGNGVMIMVPTTETLFAMTFQEAGVEL